MSSPRTTPTSPSSPSRTVVRTHEVATRLVGYRIAAYVTGVMLLLLTTEVLLHWVFEDPRYHWLAWIPFVHGFLYLGYVVTTVLLGTSLRWQPGRMVRVALAGMIPLMSFVAERSVTGEVRRQLATPRR
ncbi:MAG: DUF3817 domain-containing protein [Pseudonocardiales bacterium]|nr:DUF3817 domain-containing protein [Pseudonocardiales bacterium]